MKSVGGVIVWKSRPEGGWGVGERAVGAGAGLCPGSGLSVLCDRGRSLALLSLVCLWTTVLSAVQQMWA